MTLSPGGIIRKHFDKPPHETQARASSVNISASWTVFLCAALDIMAGVLSANSSSLSEQNCSFLSSVNLYLVVVAITGLPLNVLPWIVCYSRLRTRRNSRDVLLSALILVDFLTICIPLPIYLSMYANCSKSPPIQPLGRPTICEMFHLMYIWLKLGSLFIITTLNYTSYLAVTSRGLYRSIGDRISSSFSCSANEQMPRETRKTSVVIANLVVGIALVAFLIASLPYLGLGPEGKLPVETNIETNPLCCLEQISYPRQNKEYTFLFALLMSSSACFLLQIVHNISSCFSCSKDAASDSAPNASRSWNIYNRRLGAERNYAKMICVLGLSFHLTWIPVMVRTKILSLLLNPEDEKIDRSEGEDGKCFETKVAQLCFATCFLSEDYISLTCKAFHLRDKENENALTKTRNGSASC